MDVAVVDVARSDVARSDVAISNMLPKSGPTPASARALAAFSEVRHPTKFCRPPACNAFGDTMSMPAAVLSVSLVLLLSACASAPPVPAAEDTRASHASQTSLYEQLGGAPAISALVDALVAEYKADPGISSRFDLPPAELGYLRERLIEQLCAATGGGCQYTGLPMSDAHSGMAISQSEFDAFMQATARAMTKVGVNNDHQRTLASVLEGMRGEIVDQ